MPEGISHKRTVGKFGSTSSSNRWRWKTPLAKGIPLDLPLLPEAFCNVAVGHKLLGVLYWKNKQKCENWETLMPHSPKTIRLTKRLTEILENLPHP